MTQVSSLYVHVPFCKHLCNYCDFYKKLYDSQSSQTDEFHQFLTDSWGQGQKLFSQHQVSWAPLESLYLGGGTPSLWGERGACFLAQLLGEELILSPGCEFTMEVDPGTWSESMIGAWQEIGLNRISIGTQTLSADFLKIMDRSHSLDETHELLSFCQSQKWNFSLDFLLGLPYSRVKKRNIKQELDELLAYQPKHVSLYILNARSKYPHSQHLPDDDFIREEYLLVSEYLRCEGFHHYEVSNFALPGFESKHNLKYWKSESVAALGPTATGLLALNSNEALRYKWKVTKAQFELEHLGPKEIELERIYLSLRTTSGWVPGNWSDQLLQLVGQWKSKGYLLFSDASRIILSPLGFLMLDSLMDDLFKIGF
jgi:oxygen-independent coproporphyrinogen III oxidase